MREEKQFLLDEIKEMIDGSSAMVLTKYQKLDPNLASQFRTLIINSGGDFEVVRKRIFLKAASASSISLDEDVLQGHIGVIFAKSDPVQVTKALYDFC